MLIPYTTKILPTPESTDVALNAKIIIQFDEDAFDFKNPPHLSEINGFGVPHDFIEVKCPIQAQDLRQYPPIDFNAAEICPGTLTFDLASKTFTFIPTGIFYAGVRYSVSIDFNKIRSMAQTAIPAETTAKPTTFSFTTQKPVNETIRLQILKKDGVKKARKLVAMIWHSLLILLLF